MIPRGFPKLRIFLANLLLLTSLPGLAIEPNALPPGARPCDSDLFPSDHGRFLILNSEQFVQYPGVDPFPGFRTVLSGYQEFVSPPTYSASNVLVLAPGGYRTLLSPGPDGAFSATNRFGTEDFAKKTGPGEWLVRFSARTPGQPDSSAFLQHTTGDRTPPIPRNSQIEACLSIDPASPFELAWDAWTGMSSNDRMALAVVDSQGKVVFSAATDCSGEIPLARGAASVALPAGRLEAASVYGVYLTFATSLGTASDPATRIVSSAYQARTTLFTLATRLPAQPEFATLSAMRIGRTSASFTVQGSANAGYRIESSTNSLDWTSESFAATGINGLRTVSLQFPDDGFLRTFRAVRTLNPEPGKPARIVGLHRPRPDSFQGWIEGTPGARYCLQTSRDGVEWTTPIWEGLYPANFLPGFMPPGATNGRVAFGHRPPPTDGLTLFRVVAWPGFVNV